MPGLVANDGRTTISAEEASRKVKEDALRRNSKRIADVPDEIKEIAAGQPVKIYNIARFPKTPRVIELGSLGAHVIMPCEFGKKYSEPHVISSMIFETVCTNSMNEMENRPISGRVVALDIIGKGAGKHKSQDLTDWGVFIASQDTLDYSKDSFNPKDPESWIRKGKLGAEPTVKELAQAHARYVVTCKKFVQMADELARKNDFGNIDDNPHREMLQYLRDEGIDTVDRDWMKIDRKSIECPGCGQFVNGATVAHFVNQGGCGAVINEKRVIELRLPDYRHLWEKKIGA
jgi:hypothetical protein